MIQFKFIPNKDFGNYTPVELNVDLPNDSTMEEILEYFKVFLKSMTFFDFQVETIKIVDDAEDKDELNLMYVNLHKKDIGNFVDGFYWSSSEFDRNDAWLQKFNDGYQNGDNKYANLRVRAIRTFHSITGGDLYKIGQETETGIVFDIQRDIIFECKKQDEPKLMTWGEAMEKFGGKK